MPVRRRTPWGARDSYLLGTKLGRYDRAHFDFSPQRVVESIDVSLHRMGVDYLDIVLCHDIEFVNMEQIVHETLPALRKIQRQGKVRFVGISGYPMNIFRYVLERAKLDVILSYNHYTLQNTMLAGLTHYLEEKGVGIMNASPFSARLLTNAPLPDWHKATPQVRALCKQAADHCAARGWTSLNSRCNSRSPMKTWQRALSGRRTRRISASGCSGPNCPWTTSYWERCWPSWRRSTTGSTLKADRRTTIRRRRRIREIPRESTLPAKRPSN